MWQRDRLRAEMRLLLGNVRGGQGSALFVSGEPGIGKTTLLEEACLLAEPRLRIARGRGDAMESGIAFGLLTQVLADLDAPDFLAQLDDDAHGTEFRAAKFFGALRRLEVAAGSQPLLLVLDDLHWTDPDSLALLSFLIRRIGSLPIGVLAALRPWPPAAQEAAANLEHQGHASLARMAPLEAAGVAEFLAAKCARPIARDVVARACAVSCGNPLLLEQVARAICRGEGIPAVGEGRHAPRSETLLLTRFAGIAPTALVYARAASVLGISFRPDLAADVACLGHEDERLALEALAGSGLMRSSRDGMEFAHPLFAQALYDDLPEGIRRVLHRRAFAALLDRGLDEDAAEHAVRAELVGSEPAIALLTRLGEAAHRRGAPSSAVARLQAAVHLAGGSSRPGIELALGRALLDAGRAVEAIDAASRALESANAVQRAAALRLLGLAHYAAGEHDTAALRFDQAVTLAQDEEPEVAVTALLLHSILLSLTSGPSAALREVLRARAMSHRVGAALRGRVEGTWGYIAVLAGDAAGCDAAVAQARRLADDVRPSLARGVWREVTMYGAAAKYVERFGESEEIYSSAIGLAAATELPGAIAALCAGHADTLMRAGRLGDALIVADRACDAAELATHVTAAVAAVTKAQILLMTGRPRESETWCDRAEAMAVEGRGEWLPLLRVWDVRGQRLLGEGAPAAASALYRRAIELCVSTGLGEPCVVPWAGHAVASHLACGEVGQARRALEWLDARMAALPCRWPRAASAVGHALLAERDGDCAAAETFFATALALHDEISLPLERIETMIDWGAFLRRRGQLLRARPVLSGAIAEADACGAQWLGARAGAELGLARGRRRRRREDPDSLSLAEQRVAQLAAAGMTNREIADQLWLSVNTVATHLRRIYGKLGIHSRSGLLATSLADPDGAPAEPGAADRDRQRGRARPESPPQSPRSRVRSPDSSGRRAS